MSEKHSRDEDCEVDPELNECIICHRVHSDPCPRCGGRAYHKEGCDLEDTFGETFGEM